MPGLQHLTLIGNKLTNKGLKAIHDGCPHLESLDPCQSYNVDLRGDIAKQCGWIHNLRHPLDPFDGYGSDFLVEDDYYAYSDDSMCSDDSSDYSYYSPSPPPPRYWTRGPKPNWLELPCAILTEILIKLGAIEMIVSAQKVCTLWHDVCTDPSTWTRVDIRSSRYLPNMPYNLTKICHHAIDLSRGGCVDISLQSGCQLRRLRVMYCWSISDEGMAEAARTMPFLETFEYCFGNFDKNTLMSIGMNCPCLTTFIYGKGGKGQCIRDADGGAFAIAKFMPGLRRLSLFGNGLTNKGLGAILDGCPQLESLDLRDCYNIVLKSSDLEKKWERIKDMRWPQVATASGFNGYDLSFDPLDRCSKYNYLDDSSDYLDEHSVHDYEGNTYNHWDFYGY
ncbi:hypothetical protein MLD38_035537 [Melastoma candidum]|uniref:Uncharacterized protein n=1 Tax=Melastoma candidum TaxID=119954 RepID=A0ACB9LHU8_9MYRT|nr:hypothetical protein MLD38_035537 [Melastoma candidum]